MINLGTSRKSLLLKENATYIILSYHDVKQTTFKEKIGQNARNGCDHYYMRQV